MLNSIPSFLFEYLSPHNVDHLYHIKVVAFYGFLLGERGRNVPD